MHILLEAEEGVHEIINCIFVHTHMYIHTHTQINIHIYMPSLSLHVDQAS